VPEADLGDLGPKQGEVIPFEWKWSYSAPALAVWLALILALVLPRANRDLRVLWILVPLAMVNLLWWGLRELSGMQSGMASQYDTVFHAMSVGLASLWLVVSCFDRFGGFVRFLMLLGTLLVVACLGILSYSTEFSKELALFVAMLAFLSITVLGAGAVAGKLCRGKYHPLRFMRWLALWTILGSMLTIFGFFIVGNLIMSSGSLDADILPAMLMLGFVGLLFGLCLYLLNLPFMILGFTNPLFRERFCRCLGLQVTSPTPETELSTDSTAKA
jgi:hypothetical protein